MEKIRPLDDFKTQRKITKLTPMVRLETAPTGPGENIKLPKYLLKLHETAPTDFEKPYGTRLRYPHRVASLPPGSTLRIAANPTSIAS